MKLQITWLLLGALAVAGANGHRSKSYEDALAVRRLGPDAHGLARTPVNPHQQAGRPNFTFEKLYNLTNTLLTAVMFPNNHKQVELLISPLFDPNVTGRVETTGQFDGAKLNTEYFFGVYDNSTQNITNFFSLLGPVLQFNIIHFVAAGDTVSVAVLFQFQGTITYWENIDFWLVYNAQGQILEYDIRFPLAQWALEFGLQDLQIALGLPDQNTTVAAVEGLLAQSICEISNQYCLGDNQVYTSMAQCLEILGTKPLGEVYKWSMDTLGCRQAHQPMVPLDPVIHCPHIGPTGGDACNNNHTYQGTVLAPIYDVPLTPFGFQNPNKTIAEY